MANKYNPGFAFYDTYFKSIEHLPLETQKEVCYAITKYGITGEMVDPLEMPLGYSFTMANKTHIDQSVERWLLNQSKANYKMDSAVSRERMIAQLIAEGKNSKEIAEIISMEGGKMSDSAIRKTAPWKERNDPNFVEKWLGENCENLCENSQNETRECEERVNHSVPKSVKNCENRTGIERENSQLAGIFSQF